MDLNHCHLQVADLARARAFYEALFEFALDEECGPDEVFLRNREGFVLGLERLDRPEALPAWFHLGVGVSSPDELRALFARVEAAGATVLRELRDFGDSMNFYCADPDGTKLEVYWSARR